MANNRRERDLYYSNRIDGEDLDDSSSVDSEGGSRTPVGLTELLTDILVDDRDGDLLIQQTNREDRLMQWLQALDLQVTGACRADERLKPLLKMNGACGVAEDPLLAQFTQHFEPLEVGMLARCFCVPLVSIRVGKINKEGTRFCPTSNRGNLTLLLLPSSDLRLLFIGDDDQTERLFTLTSKSQYSVLVDEIPTDTSGRSFFVRTQDSTTFYFWCSEKSKLLGIELLGKMKDLLKRKPSIVELSGISKSRLDCFASHLRAFLVGSIGGSGHDGSVCASTSTISMSCSNVASEGAHPSSSKFPHSRNIGGQTAKGETTLYQSILSPRSSSFKEVPPRSLSSHRIAARERIKCRGDNHQPTVDNLINDSSNALDLSSTSDHDKASEVIKTFALSPSFLGSPGKPAVPASLGLGVEAPPMVSPVFSPYYCWCPPGISSCSSIAAVTQSPNSSIKTLSFPLGASLLPNPLSATLLNPVQPLSTSIDFPPFLPDPLVRMSLPICQQIPAFTPLMCDPIVHVPVIDVCSSGQGYFVSAGPAMSPSIPPLHPNLVKPLIPESDSVVKGARETLRLLISGSSQGNQHIVRDTLPAILTNPDEKQNNILVAGSRTLYTGTRDINVIANSIAAMGLVSLSGVSKRDSGGFFKETVKNSNDSGGGFLDDDEGASLDSK